MLSTGVVKVGTGYGKVRLEEEMGGCDIGSLISWFAAPHLGREATLTDFYVHTAFTKSKGSQSCCSESYELLMKSKGNAREVLSMCKVSSEVSLEYWAQSSGDDATLKTTSLVTFGLSGMLGYIPYLRLMFISDMNGTEGMLCGCEGSIESNVNVPHPACSITYDCDPAELFLLSLESTVLEVYLISCAALL